MYHMKADEAAAAEGIDLAGKDFLKLLDFTSGEIGYLIDLAAEFKTMKRVGEPHRWLTGKNVVLLFEKTSTRTRCSFEVGAMDLGMGVTYLDPKSSQMGKKESIEDTARVLDRMYDGIEYRGYGQRIVECLAANAAAPVWNGLTTEFHPTQAIADMLTVREHFGHLEGLKLTFMGDAGNNVGTSLMVACAKLGLDFCACGPAELMPDAELVATCREFAARTGHAVTLTEDPVQGLAGADVIYTDIWLSMGEPATLWAERIKALAPYQVSAQAMAQAAPRAIFMHCLPSFHDLNTTTAVEVHDTFGIAEMEVTDEVFEGPHSVVFDEAENRMHSIKAVMYATLR